MLEMYLRRTTVHYGKTLILWKLVRNNPRVQNTSMDAWRTSSNQVFIDYQAIDPGTNSISKQMQENKLLK